MLKCGTVPPPRIDNLNADLILGFSFDGCYVVGGCEEGNTVTTYRFEQARTAYFVYHSGSGIDVTHTESGELVHTFKTAGPCEAVAWAPTRYCLAYGDLGVLRIIDADKKNTPKS